MVSGTKTKCLRSRVSKTTLAVSAGGADTAVYSSFVNVASHEFLPLFLRSTYSYAMLCYSMLSFLPMRLPSSQGSLQLPVSCLLCHRGSASTRIPTNCIVKKSRKYIYLSI
jgi:hypothetical protein